LISIETGFRAISPNLHRALLCFCRNFTATAHRPRPGRTRASWPHMAKRPRTLATSTLPPLPWDRQAPLLANGRRQWGLKCRRAYPWARHRPLAPNLRMPSTPSQCQSG